MTFEAYGYASMYHSGNMPMIIIFSLLIVFFTIIAFAKRLYINYLTRNVRGVV